MRPWTLVCVFAACHTPPPVPPTPDADASPLPVIVDAEPPTPTDGPKTPCELACERMATLGCPEGNAGDCVRVMATHDGRGDLRTPYGKPLTCSDVSQAATVAAERALGIGCGQ